MIIQQFHSSLFTCYKNSISTDCSTYRWPIGRWAVVSCYQGTIHTSSMVPIIAFFSSYIHQSTGWCLIYWSHCPPERIPSPYIVVQADYPLMRHIIPCNHNSHIQYDFHYHIVHLLKGIPSPKTGGVYTLYT